MLISVVYGLDGVGLMFNIVCFHSNWVHCKNRGVEVTPICGVNCLCDLDTPCQYSDTFCWCYPSTKECHSDTLP